MKPYSSSSEKENCSPLSSNCVEWQGPALSCINMCKGDSVSDIVYKVSEKVCDLQDTALLTNVNLTCLLESCSTLQAPTTNALGPVLQTIVDGICCSVNKLSLSTSTLSARTSNLYNEPSLVLPTNLQYVDPSTGLPVAQLPLGRFAESIGSTTSQLKITVDLHTTQISNQEQRLQTVESTPGYTPPLVTPLCSYGSVISGIPVSMDLLLNVLENDYCIYKVGIGLLTDIGNAISKECSFLGSTAALGQSGNMSGIPGWNNSVNNLAQSIQNLWITVCDMRTAVNTIKQNIVPDCSQFILGYQVIRLSGGEQIKLVFNSDTTIPSGFTNCSGLSTVSITDGVYTVDHTLDLTAVVAAGATGITYTIVGTGINMSLPITVTVVGCLIKDSVTCSKTVTNISYPVTTTTTAAPNTLYTFVVNSTDYDDATGNTDTTHNGVVFYSYINGTTGIPHVEAFSTSGIPAGGDRCVKAGTVPIIYYYKDDGILLATSLATPAGTC